MAGWHRKKVWWLVKGWECFERKVTVGVWPAKPECEALTCVWIRMLRVRWRPADAGRRRNDLRKNENASNEKWWKRSVLTTGKTKLDVLQAVYVSCRQRNWNILGTENGKEVKKIDDSGGKAGSPEASGDDGGRLGQSSRKSSSSFLWKQQAAGKSCSSYFCVLQNPFSSF